MEGETNAAIMRRRQYDKFIGTDKVGEPSYESRYADQDYSHERHYDEDYGRDAYSEEPTYTHELVGVGEEREDDHELSRHELSAVKKTCAAVPGRIQKMIAAKGSTFEPRKKK